MNTNIPQCLSPCSWVARTIQAVIGVAALCAFCLFLAGCSTNNTKISSVEDGKALHVVTSFYTMEDFTKKIGGDRVQVTNLVPAGTEPHSWEPSPKDMQTFEQADLFIYSGGGFETWVDDVLSSVQSKHLVPVEASKNVSLINGDAENSLHHEDEEGHTHVTASGSDPHVWLDPNNAKIEMKNICDALCASDPEGADYYRANYETYATKLDELDEEYRTQLANITNRTVIVSHQAFGYLCHAYGLFQVPIEGLSADSEPDAKTMAEIIKIAQENNVKVIFSEELVSPKVAQSIADATGARCEVLNPLEGLTEEQLAEGQDYFSVMESNLEKLVGALS